MGAVARFVAPLLLLLLLLAGSARLVVAQQTVDEAAYWDLVARTRAALAASEPVEVLAEEWDALTAVMLESGEVLGVETGYLVQLLRDESADRDRVLGLFDTLQSAESNFAPPPADPAAATELERVLARSEFDYSPEAPSIRDAIIQRLLEALFGSRGAGALVDFFAGVWPFIAVLVIGGSVIYLLRTVRGQFASSASVAAGDPYVPDLTPSAALSRAEERSQSGDYRDAVRYLYLAVLLDLDERGVLDYDRTRTNREVVRAMRNDPEMAGELQAVVTVFDDVWYGFHPLSEATYRDYERRVAALRARRAASPQAEAV